MIEIIYSIFVFSFFLHLISITKDEVKIISNIDPYFEINFSLSIV